MGPSSQDPFRGLRVLVAEDDWLLSQFVGEVVTGLKCAVIGPVRTLEDTLQAIRTNEIDAALLDVQLGEGTIDPAADELKRRNIPFILMTGHTALAGSPRFGGAPLLTKPFRVQQLEHMMRATFRARDRAC